MDYARRAFLTGCAGIVASMAGCSAWGGDDSSELTIQLLNHTTDTQHLGVKAIREDEEKFDDALVYNEVFEVPPTQEEEIGEIRETDVLELRRYLLRVNLREQRGPEFTHHYYPGETSGNRITIRVYRDEDTGDQFVQMPN